MFSNVVVASIVKERGQLKAENSKLKSQLDKVLLAFDEGDSDNPCPSTVGLVDNEKKCGISITCGQCWREALEEVNS
ncbi:hypothetical protein [Desulfosporosinus sp. SB140]|uniref:hypothetical protein n=1 Tax=Desulfosporosinus paludis TaxID=3115649 RepID=UPI00388DCBAC